MLPAIGSTRRRIRSSTGAPPSRSCEAGSDEPVLAGPPRQLVARRKLQLPEHARDVALDRLHREVQAGGDLLVHVAPCDQLQDLALARGELVELGVAADSGALAEGVEHEARKSG